MNDASVPVKITDVALQDGNAVVTVTIGTGAKKVTEPLSFGLAELEGDEKRVHKLDIQRIQERIAHRAEAAAAQDAAEKRQAETLAVLKPLVGTTVEAKG